MEPVMPSSSVRHRMVWFRWDNNMTRWSPSCCCRLHRHHRFYGVIGLYEGAWVDKAATFIALPHHSDESMATAPISIVSG